jgi:2-polyprenyl-3-methyl-5-hydroxy-6-metoxy-1,4-benzoquinol methylase
MLPIEQIASTECREPDRSVQARFVEHREILQQIIATYDSPIVRAYCKIRFTIININILHILSLCLRDRKKVLDIGCGFGLFGCYFAALSPDICFQGYDLNRRRIQIANQTAARLNLTNIHFEYGDARTLALGEKFDAIMMIDLLHHIDDPSKNRLLSECARGLMENGRLIIKDVTTHPRWKIFFTWALDVLMTRSLDMWYWDETKFKDTLKAAFNRVDTFPISDWLPYPHIVYLSEKNE